MSIEKFRPSLGDLAKLVVAVVFVAGYTITVYTWVSSIEHKFELGRSESRMIHDISNKRLDVIEAQVCEMRRVNSELVRALDKTSLILDNLAKKMDDRK